MTMQECLEKAAQVWCKPFCSRKEMDTDLAKGFAETLFEEVNRHKHEQEGVGELLKSREKELCLLRMAYDAMSRAGWEKGPSIEEARNKIHAHLCEKGKDPLSEPTPKPQAEATSKHYKCPKCHTRFTREYPYKPSDTKEEDVETLSELADRKGFYISVSTRRPGPSKEWYIAMAPKGVMQGPNFCEDGYKRTEAKARQYLEGLGDKK